MESSESDGMRVYGKQAGRSKFWWPELSLVIGACLWGVVWYPMRWFQAQGLSGLMLTLILYASALVVSLPVTSNTFREWRGQTHVLLPLALLAGWTNIAFVLAVLQGNVVRVMLLFYLSPAWSLLLARVFLGESISRRALWTLSLSLLGALILLWPHTAQSAPFSQADVLGLTAGLAFSASNILTRALTHISLAAKASTVWAGVTALSLVLVYAQHLPLPPVSWRVLGAAVLLGAVGILAMTYLIQYGVSALPAQRSSVLMLIELLAGALSQHALTQETLAPAAWVGGGLIALAAYGAARGPDGAGPL